MLGDRLARVKLLNQDGRVLIKQQPNRRRKHAQMFSARRSTSLPFVPPCFLPESKLSVVMTAACVVFLWCLPVFVVQRRTDLGTRTPASSWHLIEAVLTPFCLKNYLNARFSQNSSKRCNCSLSSKGIIVTPTKPICCFQCILVLRVQHVIDLDYVISQRTKYHLLLPESLKKHVRYRRWFI